ncbi:MAG: VTT domain-containing protein [Microthrixaceae bacterium]|nr:VTT domain-containing protein [Microthrixaceae bacterium]
MISSLDPEKLLRSGGYILLFAIVFAESGLLIGFFLPGDSLLFVAGMASAGTLTSQVGSGSFQLNIWVVLIGVFIAAVAGDQVGYLFGVKAGPALFRRPDSRFFKHEHLETAQEFFDRHGPRAIVLARFVPIVRTFCPIVAGAGRMHYSTFVRYNVVGGLIWGVGVTSLGYFLGNVDLIANNIELALILVVALSLIPVVIEVVKSRRARIRRSAAGATASSVDPDSTASSVDSTTS